MRKKNLFIGQALALVLIFLLSACVEEPLGGNDPAGKGHTVTLRLAATVAPIPETKASIQPARSGSEAAGFYYEMVSSDAETGTGTPGIKIEPMPAEKDSSEINFTTKALATKAPGKLKNAYAFLFTSTGAFNGRAQIGAYTVGSPQDITFKEVANTKADGCRLVIVANNDAAGTPYASSAGTGNFTGFTGTYAEFQQLTITSAVNQDTDVPYAGSVTVDLSQSEIGEIADISLSWTLAKITLDNTLFKIEGGPARSNITLYNGGERRFATPGADDYEGAGNTQTTAFLPPIDGGSKDVTTWYVGENIRPAGTGISSAADRNSRKAPANACYIEIKSASIVVPENTTPSIGEEYIPKGGGKAFTYIIYLGKSADVSDFSLRRHTKYGLTAEVEGTLDSQKELATEDERVTFSGGAGLAIGRFGGPTGYTQGNSIWAVKGSYEKLLLLEPNTSRTTATDNVSKVWGIPGVQYQVDSCKYWDWTYIYGINTDGTVGGMNAATGSLYDYCYQLTLGGVAKGTWYVPAEAQLLAIWTMCRAIKENESYVAFDANHYWTSTGSSTTNAWSIFFRDGGVADRKKFAAGKVRCVRDSPDSGTSGYGTEVDGYPVIDLSKLAPLGCVLTSAEAADRNTAINKYTPSDETSGEASGQYGSWNAKMSSKFQVMRADLTSGTWAFAYEACKKYASEGGTAGQWRLPTQRELAMIWVLHPQLRGKGKFGWLIPVRYWTCTESSATYAWMVGFGYGDTYPVPKTDKNDVRCVKDIL